MSTPDPRSAEIADYLAQVRAALADLPVDVRDDLLDDLPAHLADVAAESSEPLAAQLGEPARYAAELRTAAGLEAAAADAGTGRRERLVVWRRRLAAWGERADVRVGPAFGYRTARELFVALRPGWWVLRGYLFALLVSYFALDGTGGVIPSVGSNEFAGLVLTVATIAGSVWLGRRTVTKRWQRRTLIAGSVIVAGFGLMYLVDVDGRADRLYYEYQAGQASSYTPDTGDIYPYGPDGQPLNGVRLYDENGNPYVAGEPCAHAVPDSDDNDHYDRYHEEEPTRDNVYPRCQVRRPPYPSIPPMPGPSPSPSASGSESPSPESPSPTPPATATPSPSPTG